MQVAFKYCTNLHLSSLSLIYVSHQKEILYIFLASPEKSPTCSSINIITYIYYSMFTRYRVYLFFYLIFLMNTMKTIKNMLQMDIIKMHVIIA